MNTTSHPYFVPNGDDRKQTAILLVGTADEHGIDQREVRMIRGGFRISQALADALGLDTSDEADAEGADTEGADTEGADTEQPEAVLTGQVPVSGNAPEPEPEPEPEPAKPTRKKSTSKTTNASGNRAGENEE